MYKDMNGNRLGDRQVVMSQDGSLWSVEGFESGRIYPVRCVNSCCVCYYKPEQLVAVNSAKDL